MRARAAWCAICGGEFTANEGGDRHTGWDPLDEVHAECCAREGPCSPKADSDESP